MSNVEEKKLALSDAEVQEAIKFKRKCVIHCSRKNEKVCDVKAFGKNCHEIGIKLEIAWKYR